MADIQNARERERVGWNQARPAGDEKPPAPTSRGLRGISRGDWTMFGAIAIIALATGIVNALSAAQDAVWRGAGYDLGRRLFWEMSSVTVILLTIPLLVLAVRGMRRTPGLAMRAGIGVLALLGFSALHITGMVGIRKFALWLAGGSYDFHFSYATVFYEFRKDTVTYLLIAGTVWLFDSRRDLKKAAATVPAGATASQQPIGPDLIWLRDGTSRIRVAPREILWIASAGNYIEYSLADGTRHLIRGTLAAAEGELVRFGIVRVHRTRLANLDRVTSVDLKPSGDFEFTFDNGQTLQGSRRYRSSVASLGDRTRPA